MLENQKLTWQHPPAFVSHQFQSQSYIEIYLSTLQIVSLLTMTSLTDFFFIICATTGQREWDIPLSFLFARWISVIYPISYKRNKVLESRQAVRRQVAVPRCINPNLQQHNLFMPSLWIWQQLVEPWGPWPQSSVLRSKRLEQSCEQGQTLEGSSSTPAEYQTYFSLTQVWHKQPP